MAESTPPAGEHALADNPPHPQGHASKSLEQGLGRLRLDILAMAGLVIDQVAIGPISC
jgi:hypothetical protein